MPARLSKMKSSGMKKMPWRDIATTTAGMTRRMFYRYILERTMMPTSGNAAHCHLNAIDPYLMTSTSSARNIDTISGANSIPVTANTTQYPVITEALNQNALRTLSYFSAPKLKPHTGWNPCPKPMRADDTKIMTRFTMEKAAMAESP